jgi:dephospho-CoA kinase
VTGVSFPSQEFSAISPKTLSRASGKIGGGSIRPVLVALTGGIGSGKSTVAALLAARGAVIVDADAIARLVVEPGMPAFVALVERFGGGIVAADGTLDRPALAAVAFADDESRKALGEITWPAIGVETERQIAAAGEDAIVVCDIPLLVESKAAGARPYGAVIVVEAPRELRLDRLVVRGLTRDDAETRMAAQATDQQRREVATHLVDNTGDLAALETQVDDVWADLLRVQETWVPPEPEPEAPDSPASPEVPA